MLDAIPYIITKDVNEEMTQLQGQDEIKKAVFALSGDSAAGPYGFISLFFKKCWNILAEDITKVVRDFFCGQMLPRHITYTIGDLIPHFHKEKMTLLHSISKVR